MRSIFNKKQVGLFILLVCPIVVWILSLFLSCSIEFYSDFIWIIFLSVAVVLVITDSVAKKLEQEWMKKGIWLVRCLLLAIIFLFIRPKLIPMIKDLPDALKGNYVRISGVAKEVRTIHEKGSMQYFVVNGMHFEVDNHVFYDLEEGKSCIVEYLRNSKYVMGVVVVSDR